MNQHPDIDRRSELFVGLTRQNLAAVTARWPVSASTPTEVADILAESRQLFVGAAITYGNFVTASLTALQAAELALRLRLGLAPDDKRTMGGLVRYEENRWVLDPDTRDWFSTFTLHFRNRLSHPRNRTAFTPGMAEPIVRTAHERIAMIFPDADPASGGGASGKANLPGR
jgi:hypothetical protein